MKDTQWLAMFDNDLKFFYHFFFYLKSLRFKTFSNIKDFIALTIISKIVASPWKEGGGLLMIFFIPNKKSYFSLRRLF